MTDFHKEIYKTATEFAKNCQNLNISLALAESCTGGWLAKSLTDISGSSKWFECAMITYSNESKTGLLGVSNTTLSQHGAVSEAVVVEMSRGILRRCDANISLAISGIAGPDGGSLKKPLGLVWFAVADKRSPTLNFTSEQQIFNGDRESVRGQAVLYALTMLIKKIECPA